MRPFPSPARVAINKKIEANRSQISQLETKYSQLQNDFQNNKARFEADIRQKTNNLENKKYSEQDPAKQQEIVNEISKLQSSSNEKERQDRISLDNQLSAIRQEIHNLS